MTSESPTHLLDLLNQAIARELQVSIQYMFQHAIASGQWPAIPGKTLEAKRAKFIASDSMVWLPGATLKKVAIIEMRHAEAIAKRVVRLGGAPTTDPNPIVLGETAAEILKLDQEQERGAIQLYTQIIGMATDAGDVETAGLFRSILADEENHHRLFSDLLGA